MKDHSRKTVQEERIEIVNDCLEHDKNYKETAKLFDVSYTQVYQWVKKYQGSGEEASWIAEGSTRGRNSSARQRCSDAR